MVDEIAVDICVIGGGPAGLTLASELASSSLDVVVLERGSVRLDRQSLRQNVYRSGAHPLGAPSRMRRFALGGAGSVWAGAAPALEPLDFAAVPGLHHTGWPFDYDELAPYYERAARDVLDIPGPSGVRRVAASPAIDLVEVPRSAATFRERPPGLRLQSVVRRLAMDRSGERVRSVEVVARDGTVAEVSARAFVLAAGGIENPRLLLASGIGNDHVGRFFSDHAYLTLPLERGGKPPPDGLVWRSGRHSQRALVFSQPLRSRDGLAGVAAFFRPPAPLEVGRGISAWRDFRRALRWQEPVTRLARRAGTALSDVRSILRAASEKASRSPAGALRIVVETRPDPESRVALSEERDELGMPIARIDWRLHRSDGEALARFLDEVSALDEPWAPVPAAEPDWPSMVEPGAHHMGATRMHDSPTGGAVDADGRVFGTGNLYVAGSSVFPTYGYANPTLTIVALALRLADHLVAIHT